MGFLLDGLTMKEVFHMKTVNLKIQTILLFIPFVNFFITFIWFFVNSKAIEKKRRKTLIWVAYFIIIGIAFMLLFDFLETINTSSIAATALLYIQSVIIFCPLVIMQRNIDLSKTVEKPIRQVSKTKNVLLIALCLFVAFLPLFARIISQSNITTINDTTELYAGFERVTLTQDRAVRFYTIEGYTLEISNERLILNTYALALLRPNMQMIFRIENSNIPQFNEENFAYIVSLQVGDFPITTLERLHEIENEFGSVILFTAIIWAIAILLSSIIILKLNETQIFRKRKPIVQWSECGDI
ncbi:MAG: hypothetical protein FWB84_06520 [Candidatus Bathyarchaeota archaeon]|uniref:hypothetical protein n=1 Tax=Candidatus Bathycorpusculum sp. TaxID=2994959 RepID=UPI0028227228|nr:hypothetical protein [Candidatus Termiticorpusculum sp.]